MNMIPLVSAYELALNVSNTSNWFSQLVIYLNNATGGLFGYGILVALWVIVFMTTKIWQTGYSVFTASFICLVVGTFLSLLHLIDPAVMIFLMIATIISVFPIGLK